MSGAHRHLNDMYRAFEPTGPGILTDPGDAGTIRFKLSGQICSVVTATAETRTLAQADRPGVVGTVALKTDGGDLTLTVTGGFDQNADTTITMADAGDFVTFQSFDIGGSYLWRVIGSERRLTFTSSSPSSSPSAT